MSVLRKATPERLSALSDGVFAVLITVLVVELRSGKARKAMLLRSVTTLCLFAIATVAALRYPLAGLGICIGCLAGYLRPDPPEAAARAARH